jgi:hypothetical protein
MLCTTLMFTFNFDYVQTSFINVSDQEDFLCSYVVFCQFKLYHKCG